MKRGIAFTLAAAALAACSTQDSSPLVFGQGVTVGISVGTSAANANTPEITLGVKMADIAIVPTVIPKEHNVASDDRKILAHGAESKSGRAGEIDALSTFGSFSNETQVNSVKLGIFFATGLAAQNLSNGFKCGLGPAHYDCSKGQQTSKGADKSENKPAAATQ